MNKKDIISLGYEEIDTDSFIKEEALITFELELYSQDGDGTATIDAVLKTGKVYNINDGIGPKERTESILLHSEFLESKERIIRYEQHYRRLANVCIEEL